MSRDRQFAIPWTELGALGSSQLRVSTGQSRWKRTTSLGTYCYLRVNRDEMTRMRKGNLSEASNAQCQSRWVLQDSWWTDFHHVELEAIAHGGPITGDLERRLNKLINRPCYALVNFLVMESFLQQKEILFQIDLIVSVRAFGNWWSRIISKCDCRLSAPDGKYRRFLRKDMIDSFSFCDKHRACDLTESSELHNPLISHNSCGIWSVC